MRTILVTGGSGFLGSALVKRLLAEGHHVRVLQRRKTEIGAAEGVLGDVTDLASLIPACRGVDEIYHLAGLVGYSKQHRLEMERVNVQGTANLLQAIAQGQRVGRRQFRRLVHVSSVSAIGASFDGKEPLTENSPFNLQHLSLGYFETKKAGEDLVREAVRTQGLNAVIVNPSVIYGAGDAQKGSRKVQVKIARGEFRFFTSGGVSVVAVEDVVNAMIVAMQRGRPGQRYILSGENITIQELFNMIAEEAGVKPPHIRLPNWVVKCVGKFGDWTGRSINSENAWASILFHWFDHSKARDELDFHPRPAREAIQASVRWIKENCPR